MINGRKIFLAKVSKETNFRAAIQQCFLKGGILPMERTDEFIEAMSSLSNDSVTPRFTSLARELTEVSGFRHLTWNVGLKEWGEDENGTSHSKFQNWSKSNYDSYLFLIDPSTKQFIPSSISATTQVHYCQYVGEHLARARPVTTSSMHSSVHNTNAVDGTLIYWHAKSVFTNEPDWISVDLGSNFAIRTVMWLGRPDCCTERNKNVQVWVGNHNLPDQSLWKDADFQAMNYCGMHPYSTPKSILSGVTCKYLMVGRYVTLVNHDWQQLNPMQIGEIGIFEES
ncbi:hypothetical protein TCAL_14536 [Tigriopus californicus]|uniref:Uncharacterized protein n=1 Tax=Tigriopus californicus TaxID=6832 RepID=A0A553PT76_TIGCA|nr:hypothetical protein TCAL_14536 [Tigriopus californicus]